MELKQKILEDEVIAEFLLAEINSSRFRDKILNAMGNHDSSLITNPDLMNDKHNAVRKHLLAKVRGYGTDKSLFESFPNKSLFENFPNDVEWYSAVISRNELLDVMYINHSYYIEISGGTRLPVCAAKNIYNGLEVYDEANTYIQEIHNDYIKGKLFPKIICVSMNKDSRVVVLEGHSRLTAFLLNQKFVPEQLKVIIGFSEKMDQWDFY
ncbi:MAG: hypothetical protein ACQEXQ_29750 [Bacillota bacterium]